MRFSQKKLPTYAQWKRSQGTEVGSALEIPLTGGWISDDWNTITFECPEFRLSLKMSDEEFEEASNGITMLHNSLVVGNIHVKEDLTAEVELEKAGDACENPKKLSYKSSIGRFELENPPLTSKSPRSFRNNKK